MITNRIFIVAIIGLFACSHSNRGASFLDRVKEIEKCGEWEDVRAILYLSGTGCMSCNKAFADVMRVHTSDRRTVLIIGASGIDLDLEAFIADSACVVWDEDGQLKELGGFRGSGAVLLVEGESDTVVLLHASVIDEQLELVKEHIGSGL